MSQYFKPSHITREVGPTREAIVVGLKAIREGDFAASQPRTFIAIMFHAALLELITTNGARYFLTPKGREFIRDEWSNAT